MSGVPTTPEALTPESLLANLETVGYRADEALGCAAYLALALGRPLFLEGEAGVGKTALAAALSRSVDRPLIRLQCYEGLDQASALYAWDHARQILAIRMLEAEGADLEALDRQIYHERFLLRRPLLEALRTPCVLLIDELDRADAPFEAFLLELLSEFQVTIPELGTITASTPPVVVLTSNRTREIHDAVKRRCLYHWLDYPDFERELAILQAQEPTLGSALTHKVVTFVQTVRTMDVFKKPGIAETLDWARALGVLNATDLSPELVQRTAGALLKYQDDLARLDSALPTLEL